MGLLGALRRFLSSTSDDKAIDLGKPFLMKVRVINHCFRCGYDVDEDGQYISVIEPVDDEMRERFGPCFEIYSESIYRTYRIGDEVILPFVDNPYYEPEIFNSPPLSLYTHN